MHTLFAPSWNTVAFAKRYREEDQAAARSERWIARRKHKHRDQGHRGS